MLEHRSKLDPNSFTTKYNCTALIYYEELVSPRDAIAREKQLKGWARRKKWDLILKLNPELEDLTNLL
jgi:putative endonuclease